MDGTEGGAHRLEREPEIVPVARLGREHSAHQCADQRCSGGTSVTDNFSDTKNGDRIKVEGRYKGLADNSL